MRQVAVRAGLTIHRTARLNKTIVSVKKESVEPGG